ncbi:T3SC_IA_ShcM-like domain containing protein [Oxalobacteraceae bacterium]
MDQTKFKNLCRATSRALNSKDPEAFAETGMTEIDGVPVGLFFEEAKAPDRILCYIDIGKVSELDREEIFERLLAINLLTGTKTAGVYGFDPESDSVIFVQHFLYPDLMTAEELAKILQAYSVHATNLKGNLLDPDNAQPLTDILERSFNPTLHGLV